MSGIVKHFTTRADELRRSNVVANILARLSREETRSRSTGVPLPCAPSVPHADRLTHLRAFTEKLGWESCDSHRADLWEGVAVLAFAALEAHAERAEIDVTAGDPRGIGDGLGAA